ncbi:cobalt ECF transporter T component CbiQ [Cohaesibacter celericrescens]|uniref:Cobalt ECF transporter T component CbiQ n=4 Tax=Cohaesibacter celericrescens TaxID=2067669 RepID=A0A2N5XW76_9HYPH|nr:cobalt ECF transporter T component CbiQ [Cohaesibacter celericrescens]
MSQDDVSVITSNKMWIRMLDPRVRIVSVVAFAVTIVQLSSLPLLAVSLGLAFFLMTQARLPFWPTAKRVAMMDGFIVFLLIMLPFTTPGQAMFHILGFAASFEGLQKAIIILFKANAIVMTTLSLLGTLEAVTLGHALARLKVPDSLVHLLLFTVRYIEVLHAEYRRLRTAMKCRGFSPSNSWHTYRSVGYLVGMLLIRSFERSERILQAMKCRGFQGQFHILDSIEFTRRDAVFSSFASLVMLTLVALEVMYGPVA